LKVKLSYGVAGLTGKKDSVVYCYSKESGQVYSRDYVKPDESASNVSFAAIQKNLWNIHPSHAFVEDLRAYMEVFNRLRPQRLAPYHRWNNLYISILYEMQRLMPQQVNLATLTREQIYEQNLPCKTVAAAVQSNLILPVPGYDIWTHEM
jgi:hypothetical protein